MESVEPPPEFPYARVLDEIAQAGYSGTELGPYGYLPTRAGQLRGELDRRGLKLCSAFVAVALGDAGAAERALEDVARTADLLSRMGAAVLLLSDEVTPQRSAVAGRRKEANRVSWDEDRWRTARRTIGTIVKRCADFGLRTAFHHHVGTHVETPEEIDRLLGLFLPQELGLCLDTGHCMYGGGDPAELIEQFGERIRWVHLKDVSERHLREAREQKLNFHDAVMHGVFAPLGQGVVDFGRVLELLQAKGYQGWVVVEQDVLSGGAGADTPLANAAAARKYLEGLGL